MLVSGTHRAGGAIFPSLSMLKNALLFQFSSFSLRFIVLLPLCGFFIRFVTLRDGILGKSNPRTPVTPSINFEEPKGPLNCYTICRSPRAVPFKHNAYTDLNGLMTNGIMATRQKHY